LSDAINIFLFDYRSCKQCTTGKSPAALMYNRELRTRFDLLRPTHTQITVEKNQRDQTKFYHGSRDEEFEVGQNVSVANYSSDQRKRVPGVIEKRISPATYRVSLAPGITCKRHQNQLINADPNKLRRSSRIAAQLKGGGNCDVSI